MGVSSPPSQRHASGDTAAHQIFAPYLHRWALVADGDVIVTHAAQLLPVRRRDIPMMLKISQTEDGCRGARLMEWWGGEGAALVFGCEGPALLMERATGPASLADLARSGHDDEACRILCSAAAQMHALRSRLSPDLVPLAQWFRELEPAAAKYGGILVRSAKMAEALLAQPRDMCVLHGDLHHDNVLDFGARGWLAIDPLALSGERGFDFANIFTNPDLSDPSRPVATQPGRFAQRLKTVADAAQIDRQRLASWILAWCGLSAAWFLEDDNPMAKIDLTIAELAAAELDR